MKVKKSPRWKAAALAVVLCLSLLVTAGCSGGTDAKSTAADSTAAESTPASSAASTPEAATQTVDYTKYNSYIDLVSDIYDTEDLLYVYFAVVANQPEFALNEGMDYSMLEDTFAYLSLSTTSMSDAVYYMDSEPAYPEADALLAKMQEPYKNLVDALNELSDYMSFVQYQDDNMAQAPQIHEQIYSAVAEYDQYVWDFIEQINILDESTEQDELNRLKEEGHNIAYYSRMIANTSLEIQDEIWSQLELAETLPVLDMTNLNTLYTQYKENYEALVAAMDDPEQREKVSSWADDAGFAEITLPRYQNAISDVDSWLTKLMEDAANQADYTNSFNGFSNAVSDFIDEYNNTIVG